MRGTAAGEPVVSQAQTKAFDENFDRIFKPPEGKRGGKFVFDETTQKFVPIEEYRAEQRALDAPIMSGRFYEEVGPATDGTPLNSRDRHRIYMKEHGVTVASDYQEHFEKERQARDNFYKTGNRSDADRKQRREDVGRSIYELEKKGRRRG